MYPNVFMYVFIYLFIHDCKGNYREILDRKRKKDISAKKALHPGKRAQHSSKNQQNSTQKDLVFTLFSCAHINTYTYPATFMLMALKSLAN